MTEKDQILKELEINFHEMLLLQQAVDNVSGMTNTASPVFSFEIGNWTTQFNNDIMETVSYCG